MRMWLFSTGALAVLLGLGTYLIFDSSNTSVETSRSSRDPSILNPGESFLGHADTNSGPKYVTASQASAANGAPVPTCAGAISYNSPEPGVVYVHFTSDVLLGVFGSAAQNLGALNPTTSLGSEHFRTYEVSVAGYPATGHEWDGIEATRTNPDGTVERVGAVYRSRLVWNANKTGNVLSSSSLGFSDLEKVADSCEYKS
jgi:hypothetical protein